MRAAPSLAVTVARFGVWRGGIALLCAFTAAVVVAWAMLRLELGAPLKPALVAAALGGGLSLALSRRSPVDLRWDGQRWHLGSPAAPGAEPLACSCDVMIDAGAWLLLRLRGAAPRPRTVWLPLQRRGLEPAWHALRAAVYSPRPMTDAATPAP
jgi:hypothetical protein